MICSRLALAACLISLPVAAPAQEEGTVPGAIPDPSTYQDSMVLQQHSYAQDQQFREHIKSLRDMYDSIAKQLRVANLIHDIKQDPDR